MTISAHTDAQYHLYETTEFDSMLGQYTTYGIHIYVSGELYTQYRDISTHKNKVSALVALLNQEQVSPCHLSDILEDCFL